MTNVPVAHESARSLYGDEALELYRRCLSRAFEEDAVGGVFGYQWVATNLSPDHPVTPLLTRFLHPEDIDLKQYNLVIIDSGNAVGDSWKLIYHPFAAAATFIKEA
ncbi:hypothetical protein AB4Y45_35645 [Paraburkholderia sp. EG287A]|uniref:hypothetical protein n=1 Tax=Paraburkholderia sp. EG287A TaxID=3237012 RepID=UPI0034D28ACF